MIDVTLNKKIQSETQTRCWLLSGCSKCFYHIFALYVNHTQLSGSLIVKSCHVGILRWYLGLFFHPINASLILITLPWVYKKMDKNTLYVWICVKLGHIFCVLCLLCRNYGRIASLVAQVSAYNC